MLVKFILPILLAFCTVGAVAAGLKVGVSADYPPMAYKQEGRIVGIEADNAKAVGIINDEPCTILFA